MPRRVARGKRAAAQGRLNSEQTSPPSRRPALRAAAVSARRCRCGTRHPPPRGQKVAPAVWLHRAAHAARGGLQLAAWRCGPSGSGGVRHELHAHDGVLRAPHAHEARAPHDLLPVEVLVQSLEPRSGQRHSVRLRLPAAHRVRAEHLRESVLVEGLPVCALLAARLGELKAAVAALQVHDLAPQPRARPATLIGTLVGDQCERVLEAWLVAQVKDDDARRGRRGEGLARPGRDRLHRRGDLPRHVRPQHRQLRCRHACRVYSKTAVGIGDVGQAPR
eukprot:scaffold59330_cov44-Phaeocystis_antarctica.AAC.2